jgi:hypothetical protein
LKSYMGIWYESREPLIIKAADMRTLSHGCTMILGTAGLPLAATACSFTCQGILLFTSAASVDTMLHTHQVQVYIPGATIFRSWYIVAPSPVQPCRHLARNTYVLSKALQQRPVPCVTGNNSAYFPLPIISQITYSLALADNVPVLVLHGVWQGAHHLDSYPTPPNQACAVRLIILSTN